MEEQRRCSSLHFCCSRQRGPLPARLKPGISLSGAQLPPLRTMSRSSRSVNMAEREGFEPSIPVSQYTRLAGERLRPTRPSLRESVQRSMFQCSAFEALSLEPRTSNVEPLFVAEGVGFEPTELSFNGFQDRR